MISPIQPILYLGAFLFCVGLMVVITKKNMIMLLIGIELMLNASNLNLIGFSRVYPHSMDAQMFALFVIIIAVCEAAVGLALILRVYQYYHTSVPDEITELKD
jgi:NADH:ubiquinone oxidoreductase subunit K